MQIIKIPNKILREKSVPISELNDDVLKTIEEMKEFVNTYVYVAGLSAVQIGQPIQLFVAKLSTGTKVFINPKINKADEMTVVLDGCLSIPNKLSYVARPMLLDITYKDENFEDHRVTYYQADAHVVHHECDHLEGKLFTDHVNREERRRIMGKWSKM